MTRPRNCLSCSLICQIRNALHFLDFAEILQSPVAPTIVLFYPRKYMFMGIGKGEAGGGGGGGEYFFSILHLQTIC